MAKFVGIFFFSLLLFTNKTYGFVEILEVHPQEIEQYQQCQSEVEVLREKLFAKESVCISFRDRWLGLVKKHYSYCNVSLFSDEKIKLVILECQ